MYLFVLKRLADHFKLHQKPFYQLFGCYAIISLNGSEGYDG